MFIAVLAAFAVLLAASPAPAQSPAILLNIKSPATTSPPSESLLTLDEEGNLWIKGHLYDYAFQSTITLDPNRDYWTIRDTTGKIVWALEVYNPASGASTGDLYSIGSFEGWAADPDQTDAILRYTNASSEVVFSLTAAGEARSRRTGPQRDSAPPYPTVPQPPAIVPDTTPPLLTYPLPEAEYASFENLIIPKPFAQGRFFYNPTDNSVVGEPEDVTDIPWRRRWDPAKASLQAYGARIGSRYQNIWHEIFGSDIWAYNPGFCDEDGMVFRWTTYDDNLWLAYMALNPWGMPTWVEGYSDSYWTVSSISSSPSFTSARPQTPDDFSASMSNDPTPGWNPECGATLDPATSAKSRLFRYWIEFDEKRKASAVPRKDGDRWMNVRCRIVPQNVPLDWVDHLELKVWDPAYPNAQRHRIINGDSGDPCLSKMWNGKLYVDGNESTTPYYTQASDVFMQATIHWNPLSPSKSWENNGDSNTFDEDRYAIVASDGTQPVSSSPTNFAWINSAPAMPPLGAWLIVNGDAQIPSYLFWKLTITFPRPDKTAADISTYPASGVTQLPGGATWYPYFGTDCRGGEVLLQTFTSSGPFYSLTHKVHIRGLNPDDATAASYINTHCGSHWYALPIAKHETNTWMPVESPSNPEYYQYAPNGSYYTIHGAILNQFYPYRYKVWEGGAYVLRQPNQNAHEKDAQGRGYPGGPQHCHDPNGQTVGYGMKQLTIPAASPQQVWDWKDNVNEGMSRLNTMRTSARDYLDGLQSGVEPWCETIAGVALSDDENETLRCWELEIIKRYNSSAHFFLEDFNDDGYWDENPNILFGHPWTDPYLTYGISDWNTSWWDYTEKVLDLLGS